MECCLYDESQFYNEEEALMFYERNLAFFEEHRFFIAKFNHEPKYCKLRFADLSHSLITIGGTRKVNLLKFVKKHLRQLTWNKFDFMPGNTENLFDKRILNTFQGFDYNYDIAFPVGYLKLSRFFSFVRTVWAGGDTSIYCEIFTILVNYVKKPGTKQRLINIDSRNDYGQDAIASILMDHIFGFSLSMKTYSPISKLPRDVLLLVEKFSYSKKIHESEFVTVHRKNFKPHVSKNYVNGIIFSDGLEIPNALNLTPKPFAEDHFQIYTELRNDFKYRDAGIHLYHFLMHMGEEEH